MVTAREVQNVTNGAGEGNAAFQIRRAFKISATLPRLSMQQTPSPHINQLNNNKRYNQRRMRLAIEYPKHGVKKVTRGGVSKKSDSRVSLLYTTSPAMHIASLHPILERPLTCDRSSQGCAHAGCGECHHVCSSTSGCRFGQGWTRSGWSHRGGDQHVRQGLPSAAIVQRLTPTARG